MKTEKEFLHKMSHKQKSIEALLLSTNTTLTCMRTTSNGKSGENGHSLYNAMYVIHYMVNTGAVKTIN